MAYMEKVLLGKGDTHFDFLALSAADTDPETRDGLTKSFDRLLESHSNNGPLIFGQALRTQNAGDTHAPLTPLEDNPPPPVPVAPTLPTPRLRPGPHRGSTHPPMA